MRYNVHKKSSTKSERIVYEILKELRIPFRHRWRVGPYEVDFQLGNYLIDIDGHDQDGQRNYYFIERGYVPIHFSNQEIRNNRDNIKIKIKTYVNVKSNAT